MSLEIRPVAVLLAAVLLTAAIPAAAEGENTPAPAAPSATQEQTTAPPRPQFAPKDPNFAWITIDSVPLTDWQVRTIINSGIAEDELSAIQKWRKFRSIGAEARRRGLDKTREGLFLRQFFENYGLDFLLNHQIEQNLPAPTEVDARNYYQKNHKDFWRPMIASYKGITRIADKQLAENIAAEAKKPGSDFDRLIRMHGTVSDKAKPEVIRRSSYNTFKKLYGEKIADVVGNGARGDILGPYLGPNGYDVIRIYQVTKEQVVPYEQVKQQLISDLRYYGYRDAVEKMSQQAQANCRIETSAQLLELEAWAAAMSQVEATQEELEDSGAPRSR